MSWKEEDLCPRFLSLQKVINPLLIFAKFVFLPSQIGICHISFAIAYAEIANVDFHIQEDPRMKFVWKDKRDVSADPEKVDFEEFQALKHKMIMLEEELEDVMARLEKFEALKSSGALP